MSTDLSKVSARDRLKPAREPYRHLLYEGHFLCFRKMTAKSVGSWSVVWPSTKPGKKYEPYPLGKFEHLPPVERFGAAMKAARDHLDHIGAGGSSEVLTVEQACARYVTHLQGRGKHDTAAETAARYVRRIRGTKLAGIQLQKLSNRDVEAWRLALASTPVELNPHAVGRGETVATRERSASTLNRDMTALRAALNFARKSGHVASDLAWVSALQPAEGADGRREVYLTKVQRRYLLAAAAKDIEPLLRVLCYLPLRPGAGAALTVGDFDKRTSTLTISADKSHAGRKLLLQGATLALAKEAAKDKLPGAPLFARPDGRPWNKDAWKNPFKDAVRAAGLPEEATLYCLRHSGITDLVESGTPLLTIAQISGTSVLIIERHYGHLQANSAANALQVLAL